MTSPEFDRHELRGAFERLARKLERRRVVGHVYVVGGAAMLLAYDSRTPTRDVDGLFAPDGPMLEAIWEVADELRWPRSWLNNQASAFVSMESRQGPIVFQHPYLTVQAAAADHLLAMKVIAARAGRDVDDIRTLAALLDITTRDEVWQIVSRLFPGAEIPERSRRLVEDLFE